MLSLAKTFGGKGSKQIFNWIMSEFPQNYEQLIYLEPYVGGGSVFLNKKTSIEEYINDKDYDTYCLWTEAQTGGLYRNVFDIPYDRQLFNTYKNSIGGITSLLAPNVAVSEFVLRNMSRSGMKKHFSWSDRERGGRPEG